MTGDVSSETPEAQSTVRHTRANPAFFMHKVPVNTGHAGKDLTRKTSDLSMNSNVITVGTSTYDSLNRDSPNSLDRLELGLEGRSENAESTRARWKGLSTRVE
jgi:hypothetical protein